MDYRDNRQRWAESHQVVHFYAGQWCTFTPALTAEYLGDRFPRGVVLYDGETSICFGERLHAEPPTFASAHTGIRKRLSECGGQLGLADTGEPHKPLPGCNPGYEPDSCRNAR